MNTRMDVDNEERVKIMRNLVSEMNTELGKVHELVYFIF
jgi:aromatic ring hydroxylase